MSHYQDERDNFYATKPQKSSPGLVDLLKRNNVEPTMLSHLDIKLARKFMPKNYKGE